MANERPSFPEKSTAAIEGAADGLADGLDRERIEDDVHGAFQQADEAFASSPSPRSERLRARLEQLDKKVERAIGKTRVRARAVAQSARRARDAPPAVAQDLKGAAKSWAGGLAASVGFTVAAGLVGLVALAVLTVGFVQGLNEAMGEPWGTFVVAVAYGIGALALHSVGRRKAEKGRLDARVRLAAAKEEVRRVARPVRRAFRGDMDGQADGHAAGRADGFAGRPPQAPPLQPTGAGPYHDR